MRIDLTPPLAPKAVAIGFDPVEDVFYGYAFKRRGLWTVLANRRTVGCVGASFAAIAIDRVRDHVDNISPDYAEMLAEHRTRVEHLGEMLRTATITEMGGWEVNTDPCGSADETADVIGNRIGGRYRIIHLADDLQAAVRLDDGQAGTVNVRATALLRILGEYRGYFNGRVVFASTRIDGTAPLSMLHVHRLHEMHTEMRPVRIGDTVLLKKDGTACRAKVTALHPIIENGSPGFDALRDDGSPLWAHDDQIVRVLDRPNQP